MNPLSPLFFRTLPKRLIPVALLALLSGTPVEAQVVEWTAFTRGRMADIYADDPSPTELLTGAVSMANLSNAAFGTSDADRRAGVRAARFDYVDYEERPASNTAAIIARDRDVAVVAVRGSSSFQEFALDASVVVDPSAELRGAHIGFATAARDLTGWVVDTLDTLRADGVTTVWLTGHSLGGAVAQLLARRLVDRGFPVERVMTFGSPAPGKAEWRTRYGSSLRSKTHLFENDGDIVPCTPPNEYQWIQNGHVHVVDDFGGFDLYTSTSCRGLVPLPDYAQPCGNEGLKRALSFFFGPVVDFHCDVTDPAQALIDLLVDVVNGADFSAHRVARYLRNLPLARTASLSSP